MTRIAILGESLSSICAAHHLLDLLPEVDIHLISERAEIGLMGEIPGLISSWPPCSSHWISDMASQTPNKSSTAVRGSWFLKALGIQLSKRRCTIHLRTRVTTVSGNAIHFVGAGPMGSSTLTVDHMLDLRSTGPQPTQWFGIVYRSEDTPLSDVIGRRSDGTAEVWSTNKKERNLKALQEMTWYGEDPESFITNEVETGKYLAEKIVDTIIHPVEQ